jgi:hypothetical protein
MEVAAGGVLRKVRPSALRDVGQRHTPRCRRFSPFPVEVVALGPEVLHQVPLGLRGLEKVKDGAV